MKTHRKITIQDISDKAGVSASTVSRVLTGNAQVSPAKREIVEETIRQLNYKPSHIARSLRTKKTLSIGLLLNDITNPFYSYIARSIEEEAIHQGYSLILCNINEDTDRELQYLRVLQSKQVDGVILGPTGGNSEFILELSHQIPIVLLDRVIPGSNIDAVVVNNEAGAYLATQHLLERGHHNIALATWQQDILSMQQRFVGYQRALNDASIEVNPANIIKVPRLTAEMTAEITQGFLQQRPVPTAIFALNNQLGLGVLSAIHEMHLRIPDDIALIIFDDSPVFSLYSPAISVIRQPAFEIGKEAILRLLHQMRRPERHTAEVVVLPTELIIRASV